jgi:hypothetical protein
MVDEQLRLAITNKRLIKFRYVSQIEECVVLEDAFPGSRGDSHKHHLVWDIVYARVT